jgi:drug/metabolite transporter (DMT)-like permease
MTHRGWALFALMSVLWGISYLFIKIAIGELSPVVVVASRTGIAALVLVPIAVRRGLLAPLVSKAGWLVLLALLNVAVPFLLISYGEVHITSSLTALLIAAEPILIAVIAWKADAGERVTGIRALGLAVGIGGVAALVGLDLGGDRLGLLGAAMVLLATVGYAFSTLIVKRHFADVPVVGVVAAEMAVTTVLLAPFAIAAAPDRLPSAKVAGALLVLGLLCTALALVAFYALIAEAGAGRAAVITYVNPAVAVLLGVLLLGEPLTPAIVLGSSLILAGSFLSTRPAPPPAQPAEPAEPAERDLDPITA